METKKKHLTWATVMTMAVALFSLTALSACSSTDDEDGDDGGVPGQVDNPVRYKAYDQTAQFSTDLDLLQEYAFLLKSMRLSFWELGSRNGKVQPFAASYPYVEANVTEIGRLAKMEAYLLEHYDDYMEAIGRLEDSGVLEKANTTRGKASAAASFGSKVLQVAEGNRLVTLGILAENGWNHNGTKLEQLFDCVDEDNRKGYTNYEKFWQDFTDGKLNHRAGSIFNDLYHNDVDYALECIDHKVTPICNVLKVAPGLIEAGMNTVIECIPYPGMTTSINMTRDIFNSLEAEGRLAVELVNGELMQETVQNCIKQAASNAIGYADRLHTGMLNKGFGGYINEWDMNWWGQEAASAILNEAEDLGTIMINRLAGQSGKEFITNSITIKTKSGQSIDLVAITDQATGRTILMPGSTVSDALGIPLPPGFNGRQLVTVTDRKTRKRVTKEVNVNVEDSVVVEMDLNAADDELLEENPKDGYLRVTETEMLSSEKGWTFTPRVYTNYLFFDCRPLGKAKEWITARPIVDDNRIRVEVMPNTTNEARKGQVVVMATDSKGKVLKYTFINVEQKMSVVEASLKVTPSNLHFDGNGGEQTATWETNNYFEYVGIAVNSSLNGWGNVEAEENNKLRIKVNPNTTGKERQGTFVLYAATNEEDLQKAIYQQKFDPNRVDSVVVVVNQGFTSVTLPKMIGFSFRIEVNEAEWNTNSPFNDGFDPWGGSYASGKLLSDDGMTIATTSSGNQVTVSGKVANYAYHGNYSTSGYDHFNITYDVELTFEASDVQDVSTYKLVSLFVDNKAIRQDNTAYDDKVEMRCSTPLSGKLVGSNNKEYYISGKLPDTDFKTLSHKEGSYEWSNPKFKKNSNANITITIYLGD